MTNKNGCPPGKVMHKGICRYPKTRVINGERYSLATSSLWKEHAVRFANNKKEEGYKTHVITVRPVERRKGESWNDAYAKRPPSYLVYIKKKNIIDG